MKDQRLKELVDLMDYVEAEMYKAACIPAGGCFPDAAGDRSNISNIHEHYARFPPWEHPMRVGLWQNIAPEDYIIMLDTRPWWADKLY